ncbi:DUF2986 domain-containing protein [Psychrobium sp. MM17-31]|uniref:DUF2986 domain-containing protein n=1 Tax=Psychrobium sp. MM17-31 TaxID=2917758 RepID=UPI001EF6838D|nr:DUF2986 domain-containing protein [Psychrobium sp. MM17-31]MCG7529935.1 DUF2986 domain-containing protein [Psychrobium sp. MM17-31]
MNRKKKIKSILEKKQKKKNGKLAHNNKPKYISKAERAKLEALQAQENDDGAIQTEAITPSVESQSPEES